MPKSWLLAGVMLVSIAGVAQAQDVAPQKLTLDRVYGEPALAGPSLRGLRLSPDGTLVTLLKARPDEQARYDLWAIDTATGAERMLVDSKKVGTGAELSEAEKMQRERLRIGGDRGIVTYDWAPDGKTILVPLDGDLYLATLDGKVTRLTQTEAGELNPTISPNGTYVSFVREGELFVAPLGSGTERQITQGASDTVSWGTAEFVAQEEMGRRTGYWWSPGDRYLAVQRTDESPVGIVSRAAIGAAGTKVFDQRYPAAGTPNALVDLYVMKADGSGKVKVDMGPNPDIYLARVHWSATGDTLYVERQNREQTRLDMLEVDPETGTSRVLFSEKSGAKSWINLSDSFRALKDGSLIWWSERSGHGHLYHYVKGKFVALTSGPWEVAGLVGVDQAKGRLYFTANKDTPIEQQLYSVDIARPNRLTQITESGWTNGASMDGAASKLIVSRSKTDHPTQVYLADTTGKRITWLLENTIDAAHPYAPYIADLRPTRFGTITADDGTVLYYKMITPKLEPGKTYPVFMQHYGGPSAQNVVNRWSGGLPQYIVDQGYVYFEVDNRGTANRGKKFEDAIWHAMGGVEVADQLKGVDFLKRQPFVDPAKITTFGWSYGGYMTLKLLEKTKGVFAAGIAVAPVTDWTLYDTHYTERYMGDPRKVPDAYNAAGALAESDKIVDPLLLIHGLADDNVVFDNTSQLMAKMQAATQPFEVMLYPGKTHSISGVGAHVYLTMLNFLNRHVGLPPVDPGGDARK
ncbi:DPP IV N-terminal domain-containing protein [Hephaestia sp. GCM10023244]|uniref:S9 family peptidase n=1 Tax=unclassified Hephaestia TaxID=2631281 RepID=UPI002076F059|nr:S9 family peptidase [Hephaestia sp. MAHUQ-44]MCM8730329.1 S9 family peptidase [Hephaestia sp. MAHUQ-44]